MASGLNGDMRAEQTGSEPITLDHPEHLGESAAERVQPGFGDDNLGGGGAFAAQGPTAFEVEMSASEVAIPEQIDSALEMPATSAMETATPDQGSLELPMNVGIGNRLDPSQPVESATTAAPAVAMSLPNVATPTSRAMTAPKSRSRRAPSLSARSPSIQRTQSLGANSDRVPLSTRNIKPAVPGTGRIGVAVSEVPVPELRSSSSPILEPDSASHAAVADSIGVTIEPMAIENLPPEVTVAINPPTQRPGEHLSHLPSGAVHDSESGFTKVQVYFATDRQRGHLPLSSYELSGHRRVFMGLAGAAIAFISIAGITTLRGRSRLGATSAIAGGVSASLAGALVVLGQAHIEKHGVTYTGDRGQLTRGIAEVTIPDSHSTGMVERPSLLKFEVREDQRKHVVLTSAVELLEDDFQRRLSDAVASSAEGDLLVFIHGYNVSFESALLRTAQISVDLPFEGVPVCYSWPSQGTLIGYPIDANNAEWTVHHLKQFLMDLSDKSGARSINVVAHSMGNRAMTAAMQQISWDLPDDAQPPFDRVVLAAPDVDTDRFRRDFAPALVTVANQVTLYASSDDQALVASKQVNGYPRAGDSGDNIVVVPGVETIDVSGIDLSLLGHSYYGDNESMLRDLYDVVRARLPATQRQSLIQRKSGALIYWQLAHQPVSVNR